jgi:hypothetical protein
MNLPIVTILLGTRIFEGHQATLSISETRLTTNVKVYLEDNLINMFTLLNTSDYVFITDTDLTGMRRFFLSLAESTLEQQMLILMELIFALPRNLNYVM